MATPTLSRLGDSRGHVLGIARRALPALPVAVILILAWIIGLGGVDFGTHWDEGHHLLNLSRSIETDNYLPQGWSVSKESQGGFYGYPSMIHVTTILAVMPELLRGEPSITNFIYSKPFLLRLRSIFVIISSLALLWIYLCLLELTGSRLAATAGAALLLGSWEFMYHARWVATDAVCAQWAALTLLLAIHSLKTSQIKWLVWAGAAAGAATSTKYTAGAMILIPAAALFSLHLERRALVRLALRVARAFACTFLVITPGAILQPKHFIWWIKSSQEMYGTGFGPYTVSGPIAYAKCLLVYLGSVVWSPVFLVGFLVLIAAVYGAYRIGPRYRYVVLAYPLAFLAFLCTQKVLIARNTIHVLSAIAVLAGVGAWRGGRAARTVEIALLCLASTGLIWQFVAVKSIKAGTGGATRQLVQWVKAHPEYAYRWSPRMRDSLLQLDPDLLHRAHPGSRATFYAMYTKEDKWTRAEANRLDLFYRDFGPYDVNLSYYPTWLGPDHAVLLDSSAIHRYKPLAFR